jgi:PncC family amidohydrolase
MATLEWKSYTTYRLTMEIHFSDIEQALATEVIASARRQGWCLATAESCSAGMAAVLLSKIEGAGACFPGGIVAYSKEVKSSALGVAPRLLADKTAVCEDVAIAMATGAVERLPADAAIAITGVAGPDRDEDDNPVGLIFVAVVTPNGVAARKLELGNRPPAEILSKAVIASFELFLEQIPAGNSFHQTREAHYERP